MFYLSIFSFGTLSYENLNKYVNARQTDFLTVWESVGRVPNRRNVLPHNHSEIPSLGKPFTLSHREGKDRKWAMERKTEKKKRDRVRKGEQTVRQRESDRKPKESDKERERERKGRIHY